MGRNLLLALAISLSAAASFRECSRERAGGNLPSAPVELTYWAAPNPTEIQFADTVVREWNLQHPEIHVRMQPIPVSQSTEEVLLAAIAAGTTPDVCSNINPGALFEYTQAGGLLALDSLPDFESVALERMPRELLETFKSDQHYYQMPWKTNPLMMFCNTRLFEEAGIMTLPRTYSEYLADAEKVTRDTNADGQTDVWMGERDIRPVWRERLADFFPFYIAASGGGTLFTNGRIGFRNRYAEEVLGFFRACYEHRFYPRTFFQGGDPFLLEKKATHFSGPWEIATIRKFAPRLMYDVVPIPVPDGHQGPVYTYGDFKNIAIFSTTRHPKEAWAFVKFLVTTSHDLLLLTVANQIPIRGDLATNTVFDGYFSQYPMMRRFAEQAVYTRGMDAVPDLKEIFDAIAQEYEACAVFGKKTPGEAVRDAARRAELISEWNK
jgi:multiple sugar transport system substrate-binding protein